ncbi:hypothetical protein J1605_019701 [Eschrichtius robustus]|uniref:Uncharacterized protein n=1 Tax=Eschrichtius robustus TaxID=9764 RepID=A0AB34HHX5_ESCRO|nr:hypothetical protein J1605_019701 [Eschrichtius robustus]
MWQNLIPTQRPGRCRGVRRYSLAKERLALREATPPVAPRLVARAPGKETLSFRSDGIQALWRDLLGCVSLSFRGVDGARDPASDQLKTFSLEALGPEGSRLGCRSCHGIPED